MQLIKVSYLERKGEKMVKKVSSYLEHYTSVWTQCDLFFSKKKENPVFSNQLLQTLLTVSFILHYKGAMKNLLELGLKYSYESAFFSLLIL